MRSPRCSPTFSADPGPHCFWFLGCSNCGIIGAMAVEPPAIPTEQREPAWRRACLAYHEWREAGANDHEAREAAVAPVQTVLPLPWQEASIEAAKAVAYATRYHPEWFWRGAQRRAAPLGEPYAMRWTS